MTNDIFTTADILLPNSNHMQTWSVIACDQFSSNPDYWERVKNTVAGEPSTLNMILPEAYLAGSGESETIKNITLAMENYLKNGVLRKIADSFIYVERTLPGVGVRRGLVGAVDLEEYDFTGRRAAVRASEGTVTGRLPARINIRRASALELPHVMAFINDAGKTVIEPFAEQTGNLAALYDFELMEGGGHIRGFRVDGEKAARVQAAIRALYKKDDALIIIGDGNHSLAAAKVHWDELKQNLTAREREQHPARFGLLELCNVYDPAIRFEAIHRVVFGIDPKKLLHRLKNALPDGTDYTADWVCGNESGTLSAAAACAGDVLTVIQDVLEDYTRECGGVIDYIHGGDTVRELARLDDRLGLILPAIKKEDFFETVTTCGVFPKKCFSVGSAKDKRYYLECRRIDRQTFDSRTKY